MSAASPQFELTMWRAEAASAPRPQYSLLKFIRLKTLLYSSTAVCLLTMLGSGYDMGFSSPALHYLSENSGKHTYFNRTIYRDTFNVSDMHMCWQCSSYKEEGYFSYRYL